MYYFQIPKQTKCRHAHEERGMLKQEDAINGTKINELILEKGRTPPPSKKKKPLSWIFGEIKNIILIKSSVLWEEIMEMKNTVIEITSEKKQLKRKCKNTHRKTDKKMKGWC